MGIFYALTERRYPTETGSHNVDVVNDAMARSEAARLLANPPKVLIYLPETEQQLRDRGGDVARRAAHGAAGDDCGGGGAGGWISVGWGVCDGGE